MNLNHERCPSLLQTRLTREVIAAVYVAARPEFVTPDVPEALIKRLSDKGTCCSDQLVAGKG